MTITAHELAGIMYVVQSGEVKDILSPEDFLPQAEPIAEWINRNPMEAMAIAKYLTNRLEMSQFFYETPTITSRSPCNRILP